MWRGVLCGGGTPKLVSESEPLPHPDASLGNAAWSLLLTFDHGCIPPLPQIGINSPPPHSMVRRCFHFDPDRYRRRDQGSRYRDRPSRKIVDDGAQGKGTEDGRPNQFEATCDPENVAEQKEVANHKGDDEADPPCSRPEVERANCAAHDDHSINERQPKTRLESTAAAHLVVSVTKPVLQDEEQRV